MLELIKYVVNQFAENQDKVEYLVEDKNQAFREAAIKFYREHGMLD